MSGDTEVHVFTARMPAREFEVLKAYAYYTKRSINDVVLTAVRSYLRQQGRAEELDARLKEAQEHFRAVLDDLDG